MIIQFVCLNVACVFVCVCVARDSMCFTVDEAIAPIHRAGLIPDL